MKQNRRIIWTGLATQQIKTTQLRITRHATIPSPMLALLLLSSIVASLAVIALLPSDAQAQSIAKYSPQRSWWSASSGYDLLGVQSKLVGDVNGDGYADLATNGLGAPGFAPSRVQVYHGGPDGLSTPDGVSAPPEWEQSGDDWQKLLDDNFFSLHIEGAGDLNGDGYDDFVVVAVGMKPNMGGVLLVYSGSATGLGKLPTIVSLAQNRASGDAQTLGAVRAHRAGDVNGDGYDDLAALIYNIDTDETYFVLYEGGADGLADSARWRTESFASYQAGGNLAAGLGDLNGDGFEDLLVGLPTHQENGRSGEVRIYLGSTNGLSRQPAWRRVSLGPEALTGRSVAHAGDINGDGFADFAVANGSSGHRTQSGGQFHLYLGGPEITLQSFPNQSEFSLFATGLAPIGDVNGDGFDDLLVMSQSRADEQTAAVYLGGASGLESDPAFSYTSEMSDDVMMFADYGMAGDVDGDGYDDIALGGLYPYDAKNEIVLAEGNIETSAAFLFYGQEFATNGDEK